MTGLSIQWDSAAAGTNGQIPIELTIDEPEDESENSSYFIMAALLLLSLGASAALLKMRNKRV